MARGIHRLSAAEVRTKTKPGYYADGGGLYLQVSKWQTRSWVFKFTLNGRTRGMGLGSEDLLSLKNARLEAESLRAVVREGRDPIEERAEQRNKPTVQVVTFADAVGSYMQSGRIKKFRSDKHRKNWRGSLDMHAIPKIGDMDVSKVEIEDIKRVLKPIYSTKTETARRLRGRMESIFAWAMDEGHRKADNPASVKALEVWIGNQGKAEKSNHPAIVQADLRTWFAELRKREGMAARALEFTILCASRSGEVRGAVWSEVDLDARVWTIPASRMKMKKPHSVPLSDDAVALLRALPRLEGSDYLFPAARGGMLSDMALSAVMRRMHDAEVKAGRKGWIDPRVLTAPQAEGDEPQARPAVPHGLRSTFKDWATESGVDHYMSELALAHNVGNEVERAYRRTDMVEHRRAMMGAWAAACRGEVSAENVVPLRGAV